MFLKGGRKLFVGLVLSTVFLLAANSTYADPGGNPEDNSSDNTIDDPDIPVDGGLSLLLVAGAALGGKRVYDLRKKQKQS